MPIPTRSRAWWTVYCVFVAFVFRIDRSASAGVIGTFVCAHNAARWSCVPPMRTKCPAGGRLGGRRVVKAPLVSGSGRTGPAIESIHLVLILRAELHDHVGDLRRMDLKTPLFNVAPGRQVDDDPRRLA